MPQFPSYSMNNYPQFQQPLYQQPITSPYMDRLAQLQSQQQNIQPQQMTVPMQTFSPMVKVVDSIEVVKATDIPMDGNTYYFPKADGTEIYAKQWLQNGTTQILSFKPVFDGQPSNLSDEVENTRNNLINELAEGIYKRLEELSDKVDKLSKPATSRTKKEANVDE